MKKIWLGSLWLILTVTLWSQAGQDKFRLINADKLLLTKVLDEQVMNLSGKVHFWYGDTEFRCDRALLFDQQKIARLDGNVVVNNDSLSLSADSLAYYRQTEELNAGGGVYIAERKQNSTIRWFRSQFAIYNRQQDRVTAWRNVSSYDQAENATLTCGYVFWDRANGYAYLIEQPKLVTAKADTVEISADKMEYYTKERKVTASFNVRVDARDYRANSDFLLYMLEDEKAVFTGEPRFRSDFADAAAREFNLYFQDRVLQRVDLTDSCRVDFAEERNGPRTNWVVGNSVTLEMNADVIREFQARENVRYYYQQPEKDGKDFFINEARGAYLDAKFGEDNKISTINMQQGIKGIYKFHNRP